MRAIVAGSTTHAIVFLPAIFLVDDSLVRGALELVAVAIILPLFASLLVAIGLVPLLAERLAAPAAQARLARGAAPRASTAARLPPRARASLFSGVAQVVAAAADAHGSSASATAILLTVVIALPWVAVSSHGHAGAEQADQVALQVELSGSASLEAAEDGVRAHRAGRARPSTASSSSRARSRRTADRDRASRRTAARDGATPARVREEVRLATRGLPNVEVGNVNLAAGEGGDDGGGGDGGGGGGGRPRCAARRSGGASASLGAGHGASSTVSRARSRISLGVDT